MFPKHFHKPHTQRGFTLTELLIFLAIMLILAGIIVANIGDSKSRARDIVRMKNLEQVYDALTLFYLDHGYYPVTHWDPNEHSDPNADANSISNGTIPPPPYNQGLQYYLNGAGGNYLTGDPPEWNNADTGGSWYYHIYPNNARGFVLCIMLHFENYDVLTQDFDEEDEVPESFGANTHDFGSDPGDGVYCKTQW